MMSRIFETAVLCSLLVSGAACSQPTIRAGGDPWQPAPGASLRDYDTEQVVPEPIVAQDLPQASARRMEDHRMEQARTAAAGLRDAFFGYDSWDLDKENMQAMTENAN